MPLGEDIFSGSGNAMETRAGLESLHNLALPGERKRWHVCA